MFLFLENVIVRVQFKCTISVAFACCGKLFKTWENGESVQNMRDFKLVKSFLNKYMLHGC